MKKSSDSLYTLGIVVLFLVMIGTGVYTISQLRSSKVEKAEIVSTRQEEKITESEEECNTSSEDREGRIHTFLFLGVDDSNLVQREEKYFVNNMGRADTLLVLITDSEKEEITVLSISRDTIAPVDVFDASGEKIFTGNMQINMQYSFGDGVEKSCFLTKKAVENLLGIYLDGVLMLTMEGICQIVDAVDGVDVMMEQDYTEIDKNYTKGAVAHMDGATAQQFVRYRDITVTGSNEDRTIRQGYFLKGIFGKLKSIVEDKELLDKMEKERMLYVDTDSYDQALLVKYTLAETIYAIPGIQGEGTLHDEYYVDTVKADELLKQLLHGADGRYGKAKEKE